MMGQMVLPGMSSVVSPVGLPSVADRVDRRDVAERNRSQVHDQSKPRHRGDRLRIFEDIGAAGSSGCPRSDASRAGRAAPAAAHDRVRTRSRVEGYVRGHRAG